MSRMPFYVHFSDSPGSRMGHGANFLAKWAVEFLTEITKNRDSGDVIVTVIKWGRRGEKREVGRGGAIVRWCERGRLAAAPYSI